jgi:AcrR family transcriptional regulator
MADAAPTRSGYHHGDLPASLVRATTEIVAEHGVQGFTVAEAARRSGVSSGAPFRHFADREALLAAAGAAAIDQLRDAYREAIGSSPDPAEALAAVSAAFVTFAVENPGGFELLSGAGYVSRRHPEMQEARRELTDLLVPLGLELASDHNTALDLIGAQFALANGFAVLAARGAFEPRGESLADVAARARDATLALVAGWSR